METQANGAKKKKINPLIFLQHATPLKIIVEVPFLFKQKKESNKKKTINSNSFKHQNLDLGYRFGSLRF